MGAGTYDTVERHRLLNVIFDRGIYLADLNAWLDGRVKRAQGFISHAHSDHVARHASAVLTPATQLLLGPLLKKSECRTLEYHEPLETAGYSMTLLPAGHCLGSAQALITSKATGERTLYTGDLKLRPNATAEPAESAPCDTLIIEATYGRPDYHFPPEDEVLEQCFATLRSWLEAGYTPVVVAYRTGKAQELLHHLLGDGFEVALEETVWETTQRFQEAGVSFPADFRQLEGRAREGEVVLRPPGRKRTGEGDDPMARTMALTGWAVDPALRYRSRAATALPFSDHADFADLVSYVKAVQPKRVFTVYGFPHLAAHLRQLGYEASHLDGQEAQKQLGLF